MRHFAHQDLCSFLASLVFIFSLPGYAAPLQGFLRDGDVHFYGEVVNAGCSVATDSQDQTVHMGQVRSNTFSEIGEWNEAHAFQITLEDCATDVTKNVGVMFTGETDGKDPLVFRTGDSAGSTNGIGLGISDSQGRLQLPNSLPVRYVPLEEGESVLRYTARYRATSRTVKPGNANAQVWFSLYYQ